METTAQKPHPTLAEFNALEADLRTAPTNNAPIARLCYRPDFGARVFPDSLTLCTADGVIGDRWKAHAWLRSDGGVPDPRIQVAVINTRLLKLVCRPGSDTLYPGDTIAADLNLTENSLPDGTLLQAGTSVLEVSDVFNDGCVKWKARYGEDAYRWVRDPALIPLRPRGIFCRIVKSGEVSLNDVLRRIG